MKKYFIVLTVLAAFFAGTMPVGAETIFNEMSKCVQNIGKGCCAPKAAEAKAAATSPKMVKKTDVLGNKVSTETDNSGKVTLGQ